MKSTTPTPSTARATTFVADDLKQLLDRPIAYQRIFSHLTGDPITALFLSQALHWTPRTTSEDGFFYKTQADWWTETGLTRYHQETARRKLKKLGILEEKLKGIPAQLYFKLDLERLAELLKELISGRNHSQTSLLDSTKQARGKTTNKPAAKPQTIKAKTTAKTTAKKTTTSDDVVSSDSLIADLIAQGVTGPRAKTLAENFAEEMRHRLHILPSVQIKTTPAQFLSARPDEHWSEPAAVAATARQIERDDEAARGAAARRAASAAATAEQKQTENDNAELMKYFKSLPIDQRTQIEATARARVGPLAGKTGQIGAALGAEIRNQLRELKNIEEE